MGEYILSNRAKQTHRLNTDLVTNHTCKEVLNLDLTGEYSNYCIIMQMKKSVTASSTHKYTMVFVDNRLQVTVQHYYRNHPTSLSQQVNLTQQMI